MTARRWHRVIARAKGGVAARRLPRSRRVHSATGLEYARVRHASTARELRRQWRRAGWTCSRRNPELLMLEGGRFDVGGLLGVDGLDVYGPGAVLIDDKNRDVLDVQGRSMLLLGLTVRHRGGHYPVHADCPGDGAELVLVGVTLLAATKAGLGVGLFGGQGVWAYGCRFKGGWTGVHAHTWHNQAAPATFVFVDCVGEVSFSDVGSGQADVFSLDEPGWPAPSRLPEMAKPPHPA